MPVVMSTVPAAVPTVPAAMSTMPAAAVIAPWEAALLLPTIRALVTAIAAVVAVIVLVATMTAIAATATLTTGHLLQLLIIQFHEKSYVLHLFLTSRNGYNMFLTVYAVALLYKCKWDFALYTGYLRMKCQNNKTFSEEQCLL
jgi:hypothetical protein